MKFNICVPIPIRSANLLEIKSIIEESLKSDPNLIEFRYDYINDVQQITKNFVDELLADIQPKIPVIFTFRVYSEGGQINIEEAIRFEILKTLILSQPNYLDIEMNTEKRMLGEIIHLANQKNVNLIFSSHDFDKTPSYKIVSDQIQNFLDRLREEYGLDSKGINKIILKLIFTAQKYEDNLIPLKLCKEITEKNTKIISFCMGPLGIFSRILCVLNGSFLTYGSIDEKTAPGQINIKKIRETLNVLQENE
ncbi:MAG: type I 3-dehydroquinate dehydratase [Candidatus Thorarchaeota archaeon]